MTITFPHIQGIEGDDLPYYMRLFGADPDDLPEDIWFVPVNDHYNRHGPEWYPWAVENAAKSRVVVFYDAENSGDWFHPQFVKFITEFPHNNKVYLTSNFSKRFAIPGVRIITWDFDWNRVKAYYTETIPQGIFLHHYGKKHRYTLPTLGASPTKKFLSLCGQAFNHRAKLYDVVKDRTDGYVSNRAAGRTLEDQNPCHTEEVWGYTPVPNFFYEDSCLSVFVESTCVCEDLIHLSEKTIEPSMKGHFVLPFSNPGFVERVSDLGFKFPDFIDYSYDRELNVDRRFDMFVAEFNRLVTEIDLFAMHKQRRELFEYNRQCLYDIPYDKSILEIFNV